MKTPRGKKYYIQATTWRDKKQVCFLSTNEIGFSDGMTVKRHTKKREKRDTIEAPRAQQDYAQFFNAQDRDVTQNTKHYITSPSFQMKMKDGWITVLDVIDDMLMMHSVDWDNDDACDTDVRFAWVYRWLEVTHDYYTQGCTVRRTKEMMKASKRDVKDVNHDLEREMV